MPRKIIPIPVPDGYHYCYECRTALPRSNFHQSRGKPSGLTSRCKPCAAKCSAASRQMRAELALFRRRQFASVPLPDDYEPESLPLHGSVTDYERRDSFLRKARR